MRRGIIRIISGIVLIALQLLFVDGPSYSSANASFNIGYYIGYYLPAIGGVFLLIFGGRACGNGIYSKLILHNKNKKIHTVMKWCGFALSTFLLLCNLLTFIISWDEIDVLSILNILGFLSFSVYTLFYMYKKPSCLFSAALIFVGVAYIYGICRNIAYYVLYLPDEEYFVPYIFTGILPTIAAGILYIIIASIIHKECFSVKVIRVLGWAVFALETLSRVVCNIIVLQSGYFTDYLGMIYFAYITILMMYICVFKVNTLAAVPSRGSGSKFDESSDFPSIIVPVNTTGWQCGCGRVHPAYETACVCGKSKFGTAEQPDPIAITTRPPMTAVQKNDKIRFCRKCGEKLIENSRFCAKCGTEMVGAKNMSEYEQNDALRTETEEIAMFCRKCGQKLSPENNSQCAFCGTVVEYNSEVDTAAPEADKEEPAQPETKPKKKSAKIIVLTASLSLVLVAGSVCAALFFMGPKVIPQDINTINGCPEFYNVEFGMTVGQASKVIEMKHDPIKGMEGSSYFEVDDFMKNSHIIFDEGEVFKLYGIEAASVYVSFDEKYVDAVMFTFDKKEVSYNKIADLYVKIYGSATTETSSTATWVGPKTTIDVYDYEIFSDDGEKTIIVRYTITENSQYTTLSFDGPELDPCGFLGKNNAFAKKPSYYTSGLKKDDDYSYEQFSAGSFASFEKYTLYPRFEYMGIEKGYTAITFDKDGSEDTIGLVSYLFLLDQSNAVDRMSYIEKALTQKYGAYSSCTYTSTMYSELGIVDITFNELKQKVGSNTQGIYNVQWESNGRKITLGLTISVDKTYYDGSVAYTD